jgi:hypothetical protein
MVQGGAAGLPPLFAETLLGLPLKAEFPAGASAKRAAIPAPNRSVLPKTMVQSEGGQDLRCSTSSNWRGSEKKTVGREIDLSASIDGRIKDT